MDKKIRAPETLVEAIRFFADPDICLSFLVSLRWPAGNVTCPLCGNRDVTFLAEYRRWKCHTKHPRQQFSIKVGTIFEDSPIGLDKWLPALWMLVNDKNGISSYEAARALGVTQKTAWFMLHRIRLAMQSRSLDKLRGRIEADETFIGGNVRNMHKDRKARVLNGRKGGGTTVGKTIVAAVLERGRGIVRARVVPDVKATSLQPFVRAHVERGAELMTDANISYRSLGAQFVHQFIDHVEAYVRGHVHTNGIENFWSLLKRGLKGTYINVEPFHLHRYVDEQAFRYNTRKGNDAGRFIEVLRTIVGRRLTYKELIGQSPTIATA